MTSVALALVAFAAFSVEGALGFGGTLVATSIGAAFAPLARIVPAFVPANLALSAWLAVRGARAIAWRVLVVELAPPVAAGLVLGIATRAHAAHARVLGGFVIALALGQLCVRHTRALPRTARVTLLVLGGVAHGWFATGGPMLVYIARRRIGDLSSLRATLAVAWLALNTALAASLVATGAYDVATLHLSFVLAIALPLAAVLGERLHARLDERALWIAVACAGAALLR